MPAVPGRFWCVVKKGSRHTAGISFQGYEMINFDECITALISLTLPSINHF